MQTSVNNLPLPLSPSLLAEDRARFVDPACLLGELPSFAIADVDDLLAVSHPSDVEVFRHHGSIDTRMFTHSGGEWLHRSLIYDLLNAGAEVRVQVRSQLSAKVAEITRSLAGTFQCSVRANLRLGSAPQHVDLKRSHGVLLPVSGDGQWRVGGYGSREEVCVSPGEALFLPQDTILEHIKAPSRQEVFFLFLFTPPSIADALLASAQLFVTASRHRDLQVPFATASPDQVEAAVGEYCRFVSELDLQRALGVALAQTEHLNTPRLAELGEVPRVSLDSMVQQRAPGLWAFYPTNEALCTWCDGVSYLLPLHAQPALRALTENQSLRVRDLPGDLSEQERLALAKVLLLQGIVALRDGSVLPSGPEGAGTAT